MAAVSSHTVPARLLGASSLPEQQALTLASRTISPSASSGVMRTISVGHHHSEPHVLLLTET